ncbi:ATP-binding protein [Nostoc spongiaeforme FACHB-130]|uniref:histidine kinase n=1 Tax=Nostoc spongiaeforme FACHB-130 TaxID=1357510 RepID=A0ABR8FSH2_9NOSO|nr:ATP-binding protein [Nostoc spongiaeforme]MBD2594391.1 ATP-binding protein [Nostoc spongiaeforme FACHB-130]
MIDESEEIEIVESIYTSANRLHRLAQRFLLYSNLELVARNPEKVRQIQEELDNCLSKTVISEICFQKVKAASREKDLKLGLTESLLRLPQEKLHILVEELIDNALKFSHPSDEVQVLSQVNGYKYQLDVIDHGKGMTSEEIEKIGALIQFNRKLYEQQGSGLGLAIVQHIVKLYQGEFFIHSTPGEGTKISIVLPCL